jgi:salicylate hydroxylase
LKLAGKGNVPLAVSEAARRLMGSNILQTRVYEKLRFERVRKSQLNGEDLRDRWHNALKNLDDDVEIDPEDIKMRVRVPNPSLLPSTDVFLNG